MNKCRKCGHSAGKHMTYPKEACVSKGCRCRKFVEATADNSDFKTATPKLKHS